MVNIWFIVNSMMLANYYPTITTWLVREMLVLANG